MRHMIIAAASAMLLLAGCAGGGGQGQSGSGSTGASSGSTSTPNTATMRSGQTLQEGGMEQPNMSPNEPGMGQGMTRESLTNPNRAGSGSSSGTAPSSRSSRSAVDEETISPNRPGMGMGQTRGSLPNTGGVQ